MVSLTFIKNVKRDKVKHGMFLRMWKTTKSISNIWQSFSCLLDEGIAKICKKLKYHGGFLSYLQGRTANPANLAAIFCPALVCPQKVILGIKFLANFCSPLVKYEKCCQIFERLFVVLHHSRNILWSPSIGLGQQFKAHPKSWQYPIINYFDYQCKLKQQLSKHMKNHEDPENRKYKCDICGKGFLSNQKLREHILTHANIKAYKCEFCSQAFSNFSGHRQHMMRKVQKTGFI